MWRRGAVRSFGGMLEHTLSIAAVALLGAAAPAQAETLRFFTQTESITLTRADGTVVDRPPFPEPEAGDVLDVFALDFAGNHRKHEARPSASEHVRCTFSAAGPPDCWSHVAIGGSLLVFHGQELVAGTNRFRGATGRVVSSKEVEGGTDVVVRVNRARSRRAG
jgi:hypothetical protein